MSKRVKSPVAAFRDRQASEGFVRVEVKVRKGDAALVRQVAAALSDPVRQADARAVLQQRFAGRPKVSLKALLAAAPFDFEVERSREPGRDVDL